MGGEVDPVSFGGPFPGDIPVETAEVGPLAAPHVEHGGAGWQPESVDFLDQGTEERRAMARVQEPPPGFYGLAGIAGVLRAPVLRLEQVAVAAAGKVEGVAPRADQGPALAVQGGGAVADGADEGGQDWLRRRSKSIDILTRETDPGMLASMSTKTVKLDEEAYEILSRKRQTGQSFSAVIKEHFGKPRYGTAGDLLRMADRYVLSEETLDAIEEQVQARSENPVRAAKL